MKFGLNKFGILMMGSNFREFVARLGFCRGPVPMCERDVVNKMFVELLSYSYTSPKLLHVEKITFLIELLRIYIKSTEEI